MMISEEKMTERILGKVDQLQEDMSDVKIAMEKIVAVAEKQAEDQRILADHEKRIGHLERQHVTSSKKHIWENWTSKQMFVVAILITFLAFAAVYGVIDVASGNSRSDAAIQSYLKQILQDNNLITNQGGK